jgi:Mg2+ and Co2+ transporter CorA
MPRSQYKWTLPAEISARLGNESWGAQRVIFEAGHLLLVLHAPPKANGNERECEVFLRQPSGKWQHKGIDHGERALAKFLDDYRALLDTLETRYDKASDIDALFEVIDSLIPLARSTANTKLALQAAREALNNDAFSIDMRDRSVEIARGFELLLADARLALEYRAARSAEEQIRAAEDGNRAQQKLNILAAVAFPLMSVSAVFGMNLRSGLEHLHILAFWLVFVGGVGLGMLVKHWVSAIKPSARTNKPSSVRKR